MEKEICAYRKQDVINTILLFCEIGGGDNVLKPTFHKSVTFLELIQGHAETSSKIPMLFWNA